MSSLSSQPAWNIVSWGCICFVVCFVPELLLLLILNRVFFFFLAAAPHLHTTYYHVFVLEGFTSLNHLEVTVPPSDLLRVLATYSMWSSVNCLSPAFILHINMLVSHSRPGLFEPSMLSLYLMVVLTAHENNSYHLFKGEFQVTLMFTDAGHCVACAVDSFEAALQTIRKSDCTDTTIPTIGYVIGQQTFVSTLDIA